VKLSIVSTLYRSAPYLRDFCERIIKTAAPLCDSFELVLVNDGCPGNSLELAKKLQTEFGYIRIVDLSRNFGHHKAAKAGLVAAKGERVFLIDCDGEEKPELLTDFWNTLEAAPDLDVVYGVQTQRSGSFFEKYSGTLFYKLFNLLSDVKIPENAMTVRLMSRRYLNELLRHDEREIFMLGLCMSTGFTQHPFSILKTKKRNSSYNLFRKIDLAVNALTSFTHKPLIWIFYLGLTMTLTGIFYVLFLIYQKLWLGQVAMGFTTIVATIWITSGIIVFSLGVISIYLSKIFLETKQRPVVNVREIIEAHATEDRKPHFIAKRINS
jgi:putative glycosyltransferase